MIIIFLDIDGVILHPDNKNSIIDHMIARYAELKMKHRSCAIL